MQKGLGCHTMAVAPVYSTVVQHPPWHHFLMAQQHTVTKRSFGARCRSWKAKAGTGPPDVGFYGTRAAVIIH